MSTSHGEVIFHKHASEHNTRIMATMLSNGDVLFETVDTATNEIFPVFTLQRYAAEDLVNAILRKYTASPLPQVPAHFHGCPKLVGGNYCTCSASGPEYDDDGIGVWS